MARPIPSPLFLGVPWHRAVCGAVWVASIGVIIALGLFRTATDAEMTIASVALLPVMVISWGCGIRGGIVMSVLAAGMWVAGDLASDRHFSAAWIPWANGMTRLATYGFVAYLIDQVREFARREHDSATRDALTGLDNRRAFAVAGRAEVARAERYAHPLAVLFVDLDHFKQLNDRLGHDAGDAALQAVAGSMREVLRATDRVARLGGDEFGILLPEVTFDAAEEVGRKLMSVADRALEAFPPVRASVGVAWFPGATCSYEAMLKAADDEMYKAKHGDESHVRSRRFEMSSSAG
jgi:diguanylate cyclase (GGDEF)-like protein